MTTEMRTHQTASGAVDLPSYIRPVSAFWWQCDFCGAEGFGGVPEAKHHAGKHLDNLLASL